MDGRNDHTTTLGNRTGCAPFTTLVRTSVAMATYNGEEFIIEQLDSLARQSRAPYELVVTDDGSSDGTMEAVEAFATRAPFPVRVYRNERRLGVAENFLQAANRCRGDIIAFCDQDDIWLPNKVERCSEQFQHPKIQMVIHSGWVVDRHLRQTSMRFPNYRRSKVVSSMRLDPYEPTYGFSMVFRSELLSVLDPAKRPASRDLDGQPLGHDEWILFVANMVGQTMFLADPLVLYRQHATQFIGAPDRRITNTVAKSLTVDHQGYQKRADLINGWHDYLSEQAAGQEDRHRRAQLLGAASFYKALGRNLGWRASLHDPDISAMRRTANLLRLVARGGYRSRTQAGLGMKALLRDLTGIIRQR